MGERLLIRADASARMGTGHVMRCMALAQAYQRTGAQIVFAMAESTPALDQTIRSGGFRGLRFGVVPGSLEDARQTVSSARAENASWIVADGYHFDAAFQEHIKGAGHRLILLDDYGHAERYCADLVLNQNLAAGVDLYRSREQHTELLLGTRYCLLRGEFLKWREWKRSIRPRARKILITLGGSDPENVTGKVLEAVKSAGDTETVVVVGGSNTHLHSLQTASGGSHPSIQLIVDAANMPDLMAAADLAITAGGTTVWEAAFMGLPSLTILLAQNQHSIGVRLQEHGVARNLGWHAELSPRDIARVLADLVEDAATRGEMSRRGRALVDGLGSFRVWLHMHEDSLRLRPASEPDKRLIWEWANQSAVRAVSFSSDPIPWETHAEWFCGKMADPECHFWIASDEERHAVGQVRFDVSGHEATVSVSLDSARRGQGLGVLLIWAACRQLFHETAVELIHAYIKPENAASTRAFAKAGFDKMANESVRGRAALHFQLTRAMAES